MDVARSAIFALHETFCHHGAERRVSSNRSVRTPTNGTLGVAMVLNSGVSQQPAYQRSSPFSERRIRRM
jgi:hypothetical protein